MSARKFRPFSALGALIGFVCMSAVAGLLVTAAVTPAVAMSGMAANNTLGAFDGLPEYLQLDTLPQNSTIYANKGGQPVPIATFYSQNRVEVGWNDISQVMKDAAVATEDPRFYEHGPIDLQGTLRAVVLTGLLHKDTGGGGSSITQQYVKNVQVQKCEKLNVIVSGTDAADTKKKQAAQDAKYETCYNDATETTLSRKVQEMKYAIGLEKKYSKNSILQGYLNITGFGGTVYGVQSAASYYFGTTAKELTLPQAATLVAILNNPANLRIDQDQVSNPDNNAANGFKLTLERRNYVLERMLVNKKITKDAYDEAVKTPIETHITPQTSGCQSAAAFQAAFYCDWVQHLVEQDTALAKSDDARMSLLRAGGLKIFTPLNLDLQAVAQSSLSDVVPSTKDGVAIGGSNVAVEVGTGRVLTMVQNKGYTPVATDDPNLTGINYNTDFDQGGSSGFQTGSTYKLFTLLEWLEEGHSINDYITASNGPISIPMSRWHSSCDEAPTASWPSVGNDAPGEGGTMSVSQATANSVNTAFAVMAQRLDLCGIRETAIKMGIHTANPDEPLNGSPASILGTNTIAPLTMALAYAGVANGGKVCQPIGIDRIVSAGGKDLPITKPSCTQGVDPNVAAAAISPLRSVVQNGTGTSGNPFDGTPLMGKTGTTDDAAQNWFVTSTTKTAQATWVGQTEMTDDHWVNFGNISLNGNSGRNAKLYVARPIIEALDSVYGGDAFPTPTGSAVSSKKVTVPDLTGKSPDEAQSILDGLDLQYEDGGAVDSVLPAGQVASTNPGAGASVGAGAEVTVYTSNGALTALPDVTGKTASDAIQILVTAGFSVPYSGDGNAIVTGTDPAANSAVAPGATVTLQVKSAPSGGNGSSGGGNGNNGKSGGNGG
jgi:membrane peptidoglycan carboxypeptidase